MENVSQFSHAVAGKGYEPTTVAEFLADHPVSASDVVHVEDGGWVNADGDFGSPQYINWNWPLVNSTGQFDIANGWAEDERNWAVLTAATNHVLTAEGIAGRRSPRAWPTRRCRARPAIDKAGTSCSPGTRAAKILRHVARHGSEGDARVQSRGSSTRTILASAPDTTAPTMWLPAAPALESRRQGRRRHVGWPGGTGADMTQDFWCGRSRTT